MNESNKWLSNRANHARNKAKHVNLITESLIRIDAKAEAKDLLQRALDNWWALGLPYSDAMLEFHNSKVT